MQGGSPMAHCLKFMGGVFGISLLGKSNNEFRVSGLRLGFRVG